MPLTSIDLASTFLDCGSADTVSFAVDSAEVAMSDCDSKDTEPLTVSSRKVADLKYRIGVDDFVEREVWG